MKKVTIVVPVYNGYEYLKPCIDSILKHTKGFSFKLLLLDDCSPDPRVKKYLDSLDHPKIQVVYNEKNLGFVGNCNKGMKMVKTDVVLLNTDTEVTSRWLEKLQEAAYSDDSIAAVSPFTNNGIQVSIPNQWKDNEIPKDYDVDAFAELVEKSSLKLRPRLTTGVGFCIYMKRKVLDRIGYLDEKAFERGYGEESDWCMRAHRGGFKTVLDDQTFIYHKGNVSFASVSRIEDYKLRHMELFHKRYPEATRLLRKYENGPEVKLAIDNIKFSLYIDGDLKEAKRKSILFVSAEKIGDLNVGAFKHLKDLIQNLGSNFNFYNLYYKDDKIFLYKYKTLKKYKALAFCVKKYNNRFDFTNKEVERYFSIILKLFRIDIVHFQTPQLFPLSLISLAKSMKRTVLYCAHDFLLYCPKFDLVTYEQQKSEFKFCDFETWEKICQKCLKYFFVYYDLREGYLCKRREYIKRNVLPNIDILITPSHYIKNKLLELYKKQLKNTRFRVIGHALEIKDVKIDESRIKRIKNGKLNVALLGAFNEIKGSKLFVDLVNRMWERVNFIEIGRVEDIVSLSKIKKKIYYYGEYQVDEPVSILKKYDVDLGIQLPLAAESFSYTLSELWALKIPVIALDSGAVGVRLRRSGMEDLLVSKDKPIVPQVEKKIEHFIKNRHLLEKYRRKIPKLKTIKQNMREYQGLYISIKKIKFKDEKLENEDRKDCIKAYSKYQKIEKESKRKGTVADSAPKLTWQNYCYLFLSRIGLAKYLRPVYRKVKKVFRWL